MTITAKLIMTPKLLTTSFENWCASRPSASSIWLTALFGLLGGMSAFMIFGQPSAAAGNTVLQFMAFGPMMLAVAGFIFANGRRTGILLAWTMGAWIAGMSVVPTVIMALVTFLLHNN